MPPTSQFQQRVNDLCQEIATCKTASEAVELIRQLQTLLHERIEHIRHTLITFPAADVDPRNVKQVRTQWRQKLVFEGSFAFPEV